MSTKFTDIDPEIQTYVMNVINGEETACENICLACKRFLSWFDRDDFWFDNDKVNKVIDFIGHLKHFEDIWAG